MLSSYEPSLCFSLWVSTPIVVMKEDPFFLLQHAFLLRKLGVKAFVGEL
jgi:hypothetical protein